MVGASRLAALGLAILVVAMAGCSKSEGTSAEPEDDVKRTSGRAGDDAAPGLVAPSVDGRTMDVFYVNGTFDVAAASLVLFSAASNYPDHEFPVWKNATSLKVELWWNASVPATDVDLELYSPVWAEMDTPARAEAHANELQGQPSQGKFRDQSGTVGSPASPGVVELDRTALEENRCGYSPCTWQVWLFAEPAQGELEYSYRIQVDYAASGPAATAAS
jgi:hypothetical protein